MNEDFSFYFSIIGDAIDWIAPDTVASNLDTTEEISLVTDTVWYTVYELKVTY